MTDGKLQWHAAFDASIRIEMEEAADRMQIETEHLLSKKPMQIDMLIVKKEKGERIKKNIGRIFRTYNIIEYKAPGDYLSINDFYKVYGYACFYQADTQKVMEIDPDELTITFACYHYPRKMLEHIRRARGIVPVEQDEGIYELVGDSIAMQVIVINQLSKEKNSWLQILRNDLQSGGEIQELLERYEEKKTNSDYQAVMEIVGRANREKVEEESAMCEVLREIFAEDLRREKEAARKCGEQEGKQETARNLFDMGMSVENIARAVNLQVGIVQGWLKGLEA
ncbi:MAG: 3-isopropylmalate dehydrogenase [Lachnospiraceae bacterium]|nr:3-isopropylmalate dehydrogenase [Lachnospiraceae bacterium]